MYAADTGFDIGWMVMLVMVHPDPAIVCRIHAHL